MRIGLKGKGTPIPREAMPGPGENLMPPLILNLPDESTFDRQEYIEMGYTHYEVWCIGAAGGRGGGKVDTETGIPTTLSTVSHGGAGGGGGLHYVQGLLDDLPEGDIDVDVGTVGLNGVSVTLAGDSAEEPSAGTDGGYSAFNSDISDYPMASGGKGGGPTRNSNGEATEDNRDPGRNPGGVGGRGGIGGTIAAGGGGLGGDADITWVGLDDDPESPTWDPHIVGSTIIPAEDGTWDGEIGQGGGGGVGGARIPPAYDGPLLTRPEVIHVAGHGGVGSFSYGDTSFYGAKGSRTNDQTNWPLIAGAGGGAKVGLLLYGSHAPGYSPNGAVIVRLTKIG